MATRLFREKLELELREFPAVRTEMEQLRGKDIACYCNAGEPCHGDVLLKMANRTEILVSE